MLSPRSYNVRHVHVGLANPLGPHGRNTQRPLRARQNDQRLVHFNFCRLPANVRLARCPNPFGLLRD